MAQVISSSLTGWNGVVAEEIVDRLQGIARAELAPSHLENQLSPLARISQETRVLSVWGGRGTGKSSILTSVAKALSAEPKTRFLVLGPIQPELFGPSDSILNVALAELRQSVEGVALFDGQSSEAAPRDYREILASLERAQLTAAVSQTTIQMISNAAATVDEFGRQLQRVAGATSDLWRRLAAATAQVAETCGLIVILIDDPDLAPIQTSEAFRDIRNLGSLPGVALLLGANRDNTRRVMNSGRARPEPEGEQDYGWRWPHVDADVASFEEKVFPTSHSFVTSPPTPQERVAFVKFGQTDSIAVLLRACSGYTPECAGLLERVLTKYSSFASSSPLPERYRSLVQLWDNLDEMRGKAASGSLGPTERTTAVSHVCDTLLSQIQQPRGVDSPLAITWGPMISNDRGQKRQLEVSLLSLLPNISAEGGFRDPDAPSQEDRTRGIQLQLRRIADIGRSSRWVRSDDFPKATFRNVARTSELAALLAVQEILWDSGLFELDDERDLGGGLRPPETSFLQTVRIEGQETDDYLVTLPNTKAWSSLEQMSLAWNEIVDKWRLEGLSTRSVLSLTLQAATKVCTGKEFIIDEAITDYVKSLQGLELLVRELISNEHFSLMEQELVDWYIGHVPAHWHASIFDPREIGTFLHSWRSIYPHFSSSSPGGRVQRNWTLAYRASRMLDQATDSGRALRYAWLGGYERVFSTMDLNLPPSSLVRVKHAWTDRLNARQIGAVATQASQIDADEQFEGSSESHSDSGEGGPDANGRTDSLILEKPYPGAYDEAFGEGLMEAALLAIERWSGPRETGRNG